MNTEFNFIIILFLLIAAILAFLKPRYLSSRGLFLFRAIFPSWRFFEEITDIPQLYYRLKTGETFGEWKNCLFRPKRNLSTLFINPEGNLLFAYGGLLQHFIQDLESVEEDQVEDFMQSVSYKLILELARKRILEQESSSLINEFQFKVSCLMQGAEKDSLEDVLISATHTYDS
ncbi:MAG: hypothetical protein R3A13_05965 [Bdellovibrionota bacterium]